MTITLTVTPDQLETIVACIVQRARIIGGDTRVERSLQEALYRLATNIDRQAATPPTAQQEEQTQ